MKKEGVVGWIGFLVFVLVLLGIVGAVLGVFMLAGAGSQEGQFNATQAVAAAIFFLQATLAFGFALRSMTS